jgi:hypothetical protein
MIMSIEEICTLLDQQATLRSPENDEAGVLRAAAETIRDKVFELANIHTRQREADRVGGYDRDDLGESPDY